jgi:hypothetical protein
MKHKLSISALALTGALVASASAYAAEADNSSSSPWQAAAALMGPSIALSGSAQRDVIDPPSSIDPGMTIDPPQTGSRTPIIHPPGTEPGRRLILPR